MTTEEEADVTATQDPWERRALDEGIEWEGELHTLTPAQLAWRRAKIRDDFLGDERTFRQEYPATAREAFVTSGDGFFDPNALVEYETRAKKAPVRGTFLPSLMLQRSERGYVRIWEMPDPDGHYVLGADTAEGKVAAAQDASLVDAEAERGGRDFSSADVLKVSELEEVDGKIIRVPCLRQVAQVHGRMAPEVFAQQIYAASTFWSCPGPEIKSVRRPCLVGVERNHSSGQTVLQRLRDTHKHPDLFLHRRMNIRQAGVSAMLGWITDGTTRMPMLDTLAALLREGTIGIASPDSLREMFTFVRGDDGRPEGQEGTHDDRVISLSIAVQMSLHHREWAKGEPVQTPVYDTPTGL